MDAPVMSGILSSLPHEALTQIIINVDPRTLVRLLTTCQGLRSFAEQNAPIIFSGLYHNTMNSIRRKRKSTDSTRHIIYSRNLERAPAQYDRWKWKWLPIDEVHDWKVQYLNFVASHLDRIFPRLYHLFKQVALFCMDCGRLDSQATLFNTPFGTRLCKVCFASDLVSVEDFDKTGVINLQLSTFQTTDDRGRLCNQQFASRRSISLLPSDPPPISELGQERERNVRLSTVAAFTILQGGVSWETKFTKPYGFDVDFRRFIDGANSKSLLSQRTSKPLKTIAKNYTNFILSQSHAYDLIPTSRIITPSLETATAYSNLLQHLSLQNLTMGDNFNISKPTVHQVQSYLNDPTPVSLSAVLDSVYLDNQRTNPRRLRGREGAVDPTEPLYSMIQTQFSLDIIASMLVSSGALDGRNLLDRELEFLFKLDQIARLLGVVLDWHMICEELERLFRAKEEQEFADRRTPETRFAKLFYDRLYDKEDDDGDRVQERDILITAYEATVDQRRSNLIRVLREASPSYKGSHAAALPLSELYIKGNACRAVKLSERPSMQPLYAQVAEIGGMMETGAIDSRSLAVLHNHYLPKTCLYWKRTRNGKKPLCEDGICWTAILYASLDQWYEDDSSDDETDSDESRSGDNDSEDDY